MNVIDWPPYFFLIAAAFGTLGAAMAALAGECSRRSLCPRRRDAHRNEQSRHGDASCYDTH